MPPPPQKKKLKLKNRCLILPSPILTFFYYNFFAGHFVTKVSFWYQHNILDFFTPNMTYFKEKFSPLRRAIF